MLVIYRADHEFVLDPVIPKPGEALAYDFALASQPWRAKTSAKFKAEKVLSPLARSLTPGGRLLTIQSYGKDPALEVVQQLWPGENPFQVDRTCAAEGARGRAGPGGAELRPHGALGQ